MRPAAALVLLGLAPLALAPLALALSAAAQAPAAAPPVIDTSVEVAVGALEAPIPPAGPFAALPIRITIAYLEAAPTRNPPVVTLVVGARPAGTVATISPSSLYGPGRLPPCGCPREETLESFLLVTMTRDAPAFRPGPLEVVATMAEDGAYKASEGRAAVAVEADYESIIEATTPQPIHKFTPGERWAAPATVTNFGNGASRIAFTVVEGPPEGFTVALPAAPLVLPARQQAAGENTGTVILGFAARAGQFAPGPVTVRVSATSAERPELAGDSTILAFILDRAHGPGALDPTPGRATPPPGAVMVAGVVACLALALRRGVV